MFPPPHICSRLFTRLGSGLRSSLAGEQYVIESDGLLIKDVTKKNAGTFTCRARVPQTGELEERDIRLDVSSSITCTAEL